jgi:putative ABC transport system substrate-binding protein
MESAEANRRILYPLERRTFMALVSGSLLAAPLAAEAQQRAGKPPRIGWLTSSIVHANNVDAFREGMRALGYPEVNLEFRAAAGQMDQLPTLAAELLALNVEVIVTDGGPAAFAAKHATATLPIVIGATAGDLVQQGLVASLARPGGNVTGFTLSSGVELNGKRLELLREALPTLKRVAILWNSRSDVSRVALEGTETAAKALGIRLEVIKTRDGREIERAFSGAVRSRAAAMLTIADAFLWSQRAHIVALAARHRLPGMFPEEEFVKAGGLMAYGPHVPDNFRRAAGYVDKILRGAKPADLPIEQPTKYKLAINLKTAKALGLTIPPSLLSRADEVIE